MQNLASTHPWLILAAGALVQIFTGIPSAWAIFRGPVMQGYSLDAGACETIFSWLLGAYGLGCLAGGLLQDKQGPRRAALLGTGLIGLGFAWAGAAPAGAPALLAGGFSLPVGLGCACLTPAVLTCAQKWNAHRRGLATGVIGGAMGASGLVLTALVEFFCRRWGIRVCFWVLGGILTLVCGAGSLLLCEPPPPAQRPQDQGRADPRPPEAGPGQMVRTRAFWVLFACAGLATPAVQLFGPILPDLAAQRGLPESAPALAVTLGSLGSAAGRLLMPALSDRTGRRSTDLALFAGLGVFSLLFWKLGGWWMVPLYCGLCLCYAGQAALLPALCSDRFGLAHAGVNYGCCALGMSLGSLGFPLLARRLDPAAGRHWIALAAAAAGFGALLTLPGAPKGPRHRESRSCGRGPGKS